MNSVLSYSGIVTLTAKRDGKTISRKYYNSGTEILFELYARALAGQRVDNLIPAYIDIGSNSDGNFTTHLKDAVPVIVTYVDKNLPIAPQEYTNKPFTRVEAVITKNMFKGAAAGDNTNMIRLMTSDERVLATIDANNIGKDVKSLASGVQMIVVWDLYVDNKSNSVATDGGNK